MRILPGPLRWNAHPEQLTACADRIAILDLDISSKAASSLPNTAADGSTWPFPLMTCTPAFSATNCQLRNPSRGPPPCVMLAAG
mmetsp:Transcript_17768/g.53518  ORF Transcript_17768/g.53518 Transcript_17768/m.53518 type:complete len:84 (-) Transcript_17768:519-770(-)